MAVRNPLVLIAGHEQELPSGDTLYGVPSAPTNSIQTVAVPFNQELSSILVLSPPSLSVIMEIAVDITLAATAGAPTLTIGVGGNATFYMLSTENSLSEVRLYVIKPMVFVGGTPADIVATISADGQTFEGTIIISYVIP